MGGNAFKSYIQSKDPENVLKRLHVTDYPSVLYAVKCMLEANGLKYRCIDSVREKESHGDLDILVELENNNTITETLLHLRSQNIIALRNGPVISFLLGTFQIDLIFVQNQYIEYTQNYLSWNDLGNLIGRLSKGVFKVKHGMYGLTYEVRPLDQQDNLLGEVELSTNYLDVLNLLELDVKQFNKGFDTYIQMFDWLTSSPYFYTDLYKFENLNNVNRVRDKKRKVYNMFLEYIDSRPDLSKDSLKLPYDHFDHLKTVFPFLEDKVNILREEFRISQAVKQKFNGRVVQEITKLETKELGLFMKALKEKYETKTLYSLTPSQINQLVLDEFSLFN